MDSIPDPEEARSLMNQIAVIQKYLRLIGANPIVPSVTRGPLKPCPFTNLTPLLNNQNQSPKTSTLLHLSRARYLVQKARSIQSPLLQKEDPKNRRHLQRSGSGSRGTLDLKKKPRVEDRKAHCGPKVPRYYHLDAGASGIAQTDQSSSSRSDLENSGDSCIEAQVSFPHQPKPLSSLSLRRQRLLVRMSGFKERINNVKKLEQTPFIPKLNSMPNYLPFQ